MTIPRLPDPPPERYPLSVEPPGHLPADVADSWRLLAASLTAVRLVRSDEVAFEGLARAVTCIREGVPDAVEPALSWLLEFGLSNADARAVIDRLRTAPAAGDVV